MWCGSICCLACSRSAKYEIVIESVCVCVCLMIIWTRRVLQILFVVVVVKFRNGACKSQLFNGAHLSCMNCELCAVENRID